MSVGTSCQCEHHVSRNIMSREHHVIVNIMSVGTSCEHTHTQPAPPHTQQASPLLRKKSGMITGGGWGDVVKITLGGGVTISLHMLVGISFRAFYLDSQRYRLFHVSLESRV